MPAGLISVIHVFLLAFFKTVWQTSVALSAWFMQQVIG